MRLKIYIYFVVFEGIDLTLDDDDDDDDD